MLQMRLRDWRTGVQLVAATTHLKAKSGPKNEAIRQRQVRQCVGSWLGLGLAGMDDVRVVFRPGSESESGSGLE